MVWQTNWLIFECWLLVFIILLMIVISFFTPHQAKSKSKQSTFTSDYKKQICDSYNVWDIVATLGVIVLALHSMFTSGN